MSTNWNLYEERIGILGDTLRERNINKLKNDINTKIIGSPSFQVVTYDSSTTEKNLIILSTDDEYKKKIKSLPDETFNLGSIVYWMSQYWLITKKDVDNTVDTTGEMQLCNYQLKFIDSNGSIASYWCVISDSTGGISENQYLKLPDGKLSIKLQFCVQTSQLTYNDRFLIDYGTSTPKAYKIENPDRVVNHFSDNGIIELLVGQDEFDTADDSVELMVANYNSKYKPTPPTPTDDYANIEYSGDAILYYGSASKTFYGRFYDSDNVLLNTQPSLSWDITLDNPTDIQYITKTESGNYIKLKVINEIMIGKTITLSLSDSSETMSDSIELVVIPLG